MQSNTSCVETARKYTTSELFWSNSSEEFMKFIEHNKALLSTGSNEQWKHECAYVFNIKVLYRLRYHSMKLYNALFSSS